MHAGIPVGTVDQLPGQIDEAENVVFHFKLVHAALAFGRHGGFVIAEFFFNPHLSDLKPPDDLGGQL